MDGKEEGITLEQGNGAGEEDVDVDANKRICRRHQ